MASLSEFVQAELGRRGHAPDDRVSLWAMANVGSVEHAVCRWNMHRSLYRLPDIIRPESAAANLVATAEKEVTRGVRVSPWVRDLLSQVR